MATTKRERIALRPAEARLVTELLDRVPALSYDWASTQGQAFLAYVEELVARGVPLAWIATEAGLSRARLHTTLDRFRRGQA